MMTKQLLYTQILSVFFVATGLLSVAVPIQFYTGIPFANTTFWWAFQALFITVIFVAIKLFIDNKQFLLMKLVAVYIIWILINIVRGSIISDGYWDFKGLIANSLALTVPIVAYIGTNPKLMKKMLSAYFVYGLIVFVLLLVILPKVAYGYYLVPVTLVTLFFPALSFRTKILILSLILVVLTADLLARSNVIKFFVPIILCSLYYFRSIFSVKMLNSVRISLLALPIIFLVLASTKTFNIFKIQEYVDQDFTATAVNRHGSENEENLLGDTRSFLYSEALFTANYFDSWIAGRSPARGTLSDVFGYADPNNRGERLGGEVAILNIFTWLGIIGVLLYGSIFYVASYLAVCKSENYFIKILGLFVAFRWAYAWVEDFTIFSLTYVTLWLMIGMCYSKQFRSMSDKDFRLWVNGIFTKRRITFKNAI
ncbi:hypothetical protein [Aliiglaciecola lipolytica]|uniref:hypothetical protein n=1 Tax=Aliiglaciecola lipolytica TaxID=477689 RepID=UPI001C095CE7|nr:hypothetical protein [Aliiglaciecola lipolytica]MBU2880308.1 hypothetical protein [Aliiglaciecola lipolytica]